MLTIILPGYSEKNRQWAEGLKKSLKLDHDVIIHHWEHWRGLRSGLNPKSEVKIILATIGNEKAKSRTDLRRISCSMDKLKSISTPVIKEL